MMEQERTRRSRWLAPGLAATALVAVLGGTAAAQQATPTAPASPGQATDQTNEATQDDTQDPALNGSVPAPQDQQGMAEDQEEAQLRQMPGLISDQDAIAAATANGGTANAASLDNENGSVVYEVDVTNPDGTVSEVKVDAGNGSVLATESDDGAEGDEAAEGAEGAEAPEGNEAAGTTQGGQTAPQTDTAPQG